MKAIIAIAVLLVGVCLVQQSNGWYFGFYRPWGLGYGGYGGYGLGSVASYGGWGWPYYRYYRDTMSKGDISARIQCRYITERNVLSCTGHSGVVDCDAVSNFTGLGVDNRFEMYGLGFDDSIKQDVNTELIRYNLYPRSLDNTVWYNYTIRVGSNDVRLALFHSWSYVNYGFRVSDLSCYERLVSLFRNANDDEVITIGNSKPVVTVPLFGEILIQSAPVQA